MSDNPWQDDRGNKDATITRKEGMSEIPVPTHEGEPHPAPGGPFLIGEKMTGGYGKGPDILHVCPISVDRGGSWAPTGPANPPR